MICKAQRTKLIEAKKLYHQGTIGQTVLFNAATEYHNALKAARRDGVMVGGKPLWVPRTVGHLISITRDTWS